ncbi:arsenate reductase/protein-tyrosine-phosphatase family protein [Quadrisphaera oryzae]|uniref:arsenate reductase/protein-tyrosine-phosphatase family protein n=1 Tax=Quadrisphaera TaxID=317661 RepID=UPI001646FADF|nr:low molecular weight phosphatase family protein [Quadrisphaera sp. RL12-1S]
MSGAPGAPGPFVLVVCTGNICRSPIAERVLQAGLDAAAVPGAPRVRVVSAGTGAVVGHAMEPEAAAAVRASGASPDGHAARQVTAADVRDAALVLTATREHRSAVVRLAPAAVRRSFTLREAARIAAARADDVHGDDPAARLRSLAEVLVRSRGAHAVREAHLDDVVDPFRTDAATWELMESQLLPAVRAIGLALTPPA